MPKLCRICRDTSDDLVDIFGDTTKQENEPSLAAMLRECTSCEVNQNDPLPQQICESCVLAVQGFFRFKRQCEQSHQYFWQMLSARELLEANDWQLAEWAKNVTSAVINQAEREENLAIKIVSCEYTETQSNTSDISTSERDPLQRNEFVECDVKCETSNNSFSEEEITPDLKTQLMDNKPHICRSCPKVFDSKKKLDAHEKFHSRKREHKCHLCNKGFVNPGNLADHIRAHTGERPYKCPHCTKAFTQRGRLNEHIRVHTGERPFKCEDCPKSFATAGNLTSHKRVHKGVRSFQCTVCRAAYVQPGALQRHMRVHQSCERPFKCVICLMPFPTSVYLKRHMNRHSEASDALKNEN